MCIRHEDLTNVCCCCQNVFVKMCSRNCLINIKTKWKSKIENSIKKFKIPRIVRWQNGSKRRKRPLFSELSIHAFSPRDFWLKQFSTGSRRPLQCGRSKISYIHPDIANTSCGFVGSGRSVWGQKDLICWRAFESVSNGEVCIPQSATLILLRVWSSFIVASEGEVAYEELRLTRYIWLVKWFSTLLCILSLLWAAEVV